MVKLSIIWGVDSDDVESIERYTSGGFHPTHIGEILSSTKERYRILHKLGRGAFSTVWLARWSRSEQFVALKICAADSDPTHEIDIFERLASNSPVPEKVVKLLDHFTLQGPNGTHTVLVHNVLGSLSDVVDTLIWRGRKHVRKLCRDVTMGLAALHERGIVHGDLHAGNVGVDLPTLNNHSLVDVLEHYDQPNATVVLPTEFPENPGALPHYLVSPISVIDYLAKKEKDPPFFDMPLQAQIMDLGSAIIADEQAFPACTAAAVCAPEIMFERVVRPNEPGRPSTRASDVWSLACTIYQIVFGGTLFHFACPNDTLLCDMAKICGEVPDEWRSYWESQEELRNTDISPEVADAEWKLLLDHMITVPGKMRTEEDIKELFGMLRSMLILDPARRPSAAEVAKHPWFEREGLV
ncbi:kinase-like protein [Cylindrobasidium torrendii FP15055 ss-10]|uniref:non-specific serine/threonine protein kinase n=1 Tax=Cylindrobasidium torrendii FP15055 ss-10 TaxID=1314674 RepID=A0A0D7AYE1_9AGAR|nr:kinase-like protein [Cylindrobasidium torrendii FP15055 ss-10]